MFYDNYASICRERGLSPTGAAKAMGIGSATVSHWKNRGLSPRTEHLQKISDFLNVSIDQLLGIEKAATQEGSGDEPNKSALLAAVSSMSEAQAAELLRLWKVWQATQENE